MILGNDFFRWFRFVIEIVKIFARIFGDDDDKTELDKNGFGTPNDSA